MKRKTDSAAAILEHILLIALIAISAITGVKAMTETLDDSLRDTIRAIDATSGLPLCGGWGQPPC
jgi:Flp pilus assembly pilin Flp